MASMKTTTVSKWQGETAWLWVETGEGALYRVRNVRADYWVVTAPEGMSWATNSWCCHGDTTLYVGDSGEAKVKEVELRQELAERRERWRAEENATRARLGMSLV